VLFLWTQVDVYGVNKSLRWTPRATSSSPSGRRLEVAGARRRRHGTLSRGRLALTLLTVFLALSFMFGVLHMAGDPVLLLVPVDSSAEHIERMRVEWGFATRCGCNTGGFSAGRWRATSAPR